MNLEFRLKKTLLNCLLASIPSRNLRKKIRNSLIGNYYKAKDNIFVREYRGLIDIMNGNNIIRLSSKHKIYLTDFLNMFDYFYSAVLPSTSIFVTKLVDYSKPKLHKVVGFNYFKIMFPSMSEPISTNKEYLNFAKLNKDSVVLDLGGYSGFSSIMFDMEITKHGIGSGKVIVVEPDDINLKCMKVNLAKYKKKTGRNIEFLDVAMWENDNGITFTSEGTMGSNVIYSGRPGEKRQVKTLTLYSLAKKHSLDRIDFIKCDIEGAESVIFNDDKFFKKYRPKIFCETHGLLAEEDTKMYLSKYGYTFKEVIGGAYSKSEYSIKSFEFYPN